MNKGRLTFLLAEGNALPIDAEVRNPRSGYPVFPGGSAMRRISRKKRARRSFRQVMTSAPRA